jgi:hypothetical protein
LPHLRPAGSIGSMRRLCFDHPWIEQSRATVYAMRLPADRTHARLRAMCQHITETYRNVSDPEPFGWLNVTDYTNGSDGVGRQTMADHLKDVDAYLREHSVGVAAVVESAVARAVVSAVLWLRGNKGFRIELVRSETGGVALIQARLADLTSRGKRAGAKSRSADPGT